MVGMAADTTTAAAAAAVEHTTTGVAVEQTNLVVTTEAASNNRTHREKSNLVNSESIVGCTDVIATTTDLSALMLSQVTFLTRQGPIQREEIPRIVTTFSCQVSLESQTIGEDDGTRKAQATSTTVWRYDTTAVEQWFWHSTNI